MALGKKVSPAKFIGAISGALGIAQGAMSIFGGVQERKRLRGDMKRTRKQFEENKRILQDQRFVNPYADLQTNFENPYEDLTVNTQQADFEAEQAAQQRANIMQSLQASAGASGIAGLAQTMANQATADRARSSASIGQQEAANQRLAAQGAAQVQAREQAAQQTVMSGEARRREQERQRILDIMELQAGRDDRLQQLQEARSQATQNMIGGVGEAISGIADLGKAGIFDGQPKTDSDDDDDNENENENG